MSTGEEEPTRADPQLEAASTGATAATAASQCPQPPYDEDFNPFSEEDKQKILHEEKGKDSAEGWQFVRQTQYTEVWRKADPTKPVHLVKAFLQFPGIPPNVVADMIHNLERRTEWDTFFKVIEVIEEHKNFRVIYWLAKMPILVSDRDVVQFIRKEHDEATNTTYFFYRNATHPEVPEKRGVIRAETILSGVIVRPDSKDPNSSTMSLMLQTDMKGWIPHAIVNAIAARSPKQWRDSLANFYENVYSKELAEQGTGKGEGEGEGEREGGEGEGKEGGQEEGEGEGKGEAESTEKEGETD